MTGLPKRSIFLSTPLPKRIEGVDALAREGRAQIGPRAEDLVAAAGDDEAAHAVRRSSKPLTAAFSSRTSVSLMALAGGRFIVMTACASSRVDDEWFQTPCETESSSEKMGRHRLGRLGQAGSHACRAPRTSPSGPWPRRAIFVAIFTGRSARDLPGPAMPSCGSTR